ncbi:hypothetical protein [Altererythrobacter sp.]|uniref:hypothetical protein n=1 Tax=Altererythrobacter sp. TaxID=1872480 RepID=UPI003CFE41A0
MNRLLPGIIALPLLSASALQAQEQGRVAFVACPIVQDTPTVPCWLAAHDGQIYYMGIQSDVSAPFNPPSLGHKVLVEGKLADHEECGAKVIEPITISIMPELSPECDELRMAREGVDISFTPPRPPGPSGGRLAFSFPDPPPPPKPPYTPKSFDIPYAFEGMVNFQTPRVMTPALEYAQLSKAKQIEVTGYRGATRLSDGTLLVEHGGIARERAEEIVRMFRGAGLEDVEFKVTASEEAIEGGPENRHVSITIVP